MKTRADFYKRSAAPDNVSAHCKVCVKQERREWRGRVKVQLEWADRCSRLVPELEERVKELEKQLADAQAHHAMFMSEMRLAQGLSDEESQ